MKSRDVLAVFNRGRISRLGLARTDVARVALSAEVQTNWMPRILGSMMVRPGFGYLGSVLDDGAYLPFIYANDDTAILELSPGVMRIWDNGDTLATRAAVASAVTNGSFATDLTGWTDADEGSSASTWVSGTMQLVGTGYTSAKRRQSVSVAAEDQSSVHALRIVVSRGPVLLRIGTGAGLDDIFRQAVLRAGVHSIAFTPGAAAFHIEFSSSLKYPVRIDSCDVEVAGVVTIPTPWADVAACRAVRWQQSADVLFCAAFGLQQRRIERRPDNSWSVVIYESNDGPFLTENVDTIRLTPSGLAGAITLAASRAVFEAGHVGAIFSISSQGQTVQSTLTAELTYTNPIRVTGVDAGRIFSVVRTGTWVGTLTLQRSLSEPGSWTTVATYTTNATVNYDDALDNSIAYYRIGFNAGQYTSGSAVVSLVYATGSITGVVRVVGFTSDVSVDAVVLTDLGGTTATEVWAEGAWSDAQGWPSAVGLFEGRMWWSGEGRNYGSVPDAFNNFDPETIGDSQPINRRIGEGAVNSTNWMLPLQHLIVGTDGGEYSVRSTSFDEPVTPSNYNAKSRTTKGSKRVPAVTVDSSGFFVGRTGTQIYELGYDTAAYGYQASDTMTLVPEIGEAGVVRLAVQQAPDMRLHAIKVDGGVSVMVRDSAEDVRCWIDIETDGYIEDVVVLPGDVEDRVFYRVRRDINGATVRYHEQWAREDEARGGAVNKMADSFIDGAGLMSGLAHLEGREVVVWGDGADRGTGVVSGGSVPGEYGSWCVGLWYGAEYKSAKLAGQTSLGLSITQRSRIDHIGIVLADTHAQGLQFGPDFDTMDDMPMMEGGEAVNPDAIWSDYDRDMFEFPGDWSPDNRICLRGASPRPCTVLAVALSIDRQDKA